MKVITILCILFSVFFSARILANDPLTAPELKQLIENNESRAKDELYELRKPGKVLREDIKNQLILSFGKTSDQDIQENIAKTLVRNGGQSGMLAVLSEANNKNSNIRIAALRTLREKSNDPLTIDVYLDAIKEDDPEVKRWAAVGLENQSHIPKVYSEFERIAKSTDSSRAQGYVIRGIQNSQNPGAQKLLLEVLKGNNSEARIHAAQALGSMPGEETFKALIEATKNSNEQITRAAVRSLKSHSDKSADIATRLMEIYDIEDKGTLLSKDALRGIINSDDPRALPYALSALDERSDSLKKDALKGVLAKYGKKEHAVEMAKLLKHPNKTVRRDAYNAMMQILKRTLNPEDFKLAVKCFPQTQQEPFSDDTKNVAALLDIFMLGFGAFSYQAETQRVTNVPQMTAETVKTLQSVIENLPIKQIPQDANLDS